MLNIKITVQKVNIETDTSGDRLTFMFPVTGEHKWIFSQQKVKI